VPRAPVPGEVKKRGVTKSDLLDFVADAKMCGCDQLRARVRFVSDLSKAPARRARARGLYEKIRGAGGFVVVRIRVCVCVGV